MTERSSPDTAALADYIEEQTPSPLLPMQDILLDRDERQMIINALRAAHCSAGSDAAATPSSLQGMIAAIYGELDAEDCNWIDREWIKWRGKGTITHALTGDVAQASAVREALELAEDVLSRRPFSAGIWPNGMHPQTGIEKIRAALSSLSSPDRQGSSQPSKISLLSPSLGWSDSEA